MFTKLRSYHSIFIISILLTVLTFSVTTAQIKLEQFDNFIHYDELNGLASTYINGIVEDKNGFLWLGTANGVSVFDGNHFVNYDTFQERGKTYKLGFIQKILMNSSGDSVFVATDQGILNTSVDKVEFKSINEMFISSGDNLNKKVSDFVIYKSDIFWAGMHDKGLLKIDIKRKNIEEISFKYETGYDNFLINRIVCITKDPQNSDILWIGTLGGIIKFNAETNDYQVFVFNDDPKMPQNRIRKIKVFRDKVFLGSWEKGMIIFDKKNNEFKEPLKEKYPDSNILVLDIFNDNDKNIWITTSDGLIQYNIQKDTINDVIDHHIEEGLFRGISFVDSRGIIWFGYGRGLYKYDPLISENPFLELEKRNSIQNPMLVREIIRSDNSIYLAGQYSSGLYKIDLNDLSFKTIKIPPFKYFKKTGYNIMDMVEMEDGHFLILSQKKIAIYNPETGKIILSPLQIDHPSPSLQSVVKDDKNNYWVGSRAGGLFRLNFKDKTIRNYNNELDKFKKGNHEWINRLFIDRKNKLWIAKGSSIVMDLDTEKIYGLDLKEDIPTFHDVSAFLEDKKGRIWMAGYQNGIGYTNFDHLKEGIKHKVDGYFTGIYPYNDSLIWTINRNLGIINTSTNLYKEIKLSSKRKRLRVSGPIIPGKNDTFIIGCNNGILIYNHKKQQLNSEIPVPYISEVESNGKVLYKGNSLSKNEFSFKSNTKHLVFKISSLGYHMSDEVAYKYKIEEQWQDVGDEDKINLTNLTYGSYHLRIKACNNIGKCNEIPKEYQITILTPWWAKWWAYLLYLGLAILFADRFYRFQLSKRLAISESERLKEVNQLKNSLYTNITHEFRTPLTVILGMADSLRSKIEKKYQKEAEHSLEMIRRNGKNLLKLVNEMLDLSKLESGNMKLQLVQSDVIVFVKYLCESYQSLAFQKQISMTVYSEVDQMIMDFDPNKLSVVISNLLSNAIKFTDRGGKIIIHLNHIKKCKTNPSAANGCLFIKVKDDGAGISENELNHIFDRFYQVKNTNTDKNKGTGIGLALTQELVKLMKGDISVKSEPGKGSEFTVEIPVTNEAVIAKNTQEKVYTGLITSEDMTEFEAESHMGKSELPLVLIIEDNKDVAHYLKGCLKGKYHTINALDGETGIEMAFEKIPDVIISDVMMPKKDGYEVCKTLKSDERTDHIPIIILTAKASIKDKLEGLSCGADAYLTKPFVKAELLTRLDQLILLRKRMMNHMSENGLYKILKIRAGNPETKFLQKIIKIIHEEISNHSFGSSVQLAHKMHLSESQIYRKLKAITGKSTSVFIRSVRLQKAKEMLLTTDKSISEIAYEVGFNDPSWFSRAFKEEFGFSPSAMSK